jgi:hypothetical protein
VLVSAGNRRCGKAADIGAFRVEFDAVNHPFGVDFVKAGIDAHKASGLTLVARY